ncbi:MAG: cyclic nucleotide-binding domain-containing protein [Candidatus Coatesbacteria bacterium]|nr:cyclic nucleotide-binding domain-containing protein [Candidatus Coatesbacteria bacterium]
MHTSFDLTRIPLFSALDERELERIYHLLKRKRYTKGDIIITEGERGDEFFLIEHGQVKVTRRSLDGREKILDILSDGSFFGELAVLDKMPRSASVEAMGEVSILTLHKDDFLPILEQLPSLAIKIIKVLSQRLRDADSQIEDLTFKTSREKIESLFIRLRDYYGASHELGTRLTIQLTHQELADMAGCSRETVCRFVNELKNKNLLTIDKKRHYIFHSNAVTAGKGER